MNCVKTKDFSRNVINFGYLSLQFEKMKLFINNKIVKLPMYRNGSFELHISSFFFLIRTNYFVLVFIWIDVTGCVFLGERLSAQLLEECSPRSHALMRSLYTRSEPVVSDNAFS
jgi:hypothetical protein